MVSPISIGEARRRLPPDFISDLYASFPTALAERMLAGMGARRFSSFRVNTLKTEARQVETFLKRRGISYRRVPWYREAFLVLKAREREMQGWDLYGEGAVYLQSLSSMVPVLVLDPRPGEAVLDLAAAPGGKTTQIACRMENQGRLMAVEPDSIRSQRLAYNLSLQGAKMAEILTMPGERIGGRFPDLFDRVLLDAPCSGEGLFLAAEGRSYRAWSLKRVRESIRVQRRLLKSAAAALKPGGLLVYSTCTLNRRENEEQVLWAHDNLGLKPVPAGLEIAGSQPGLKLPAALRLLPCREMEGFFVCAFRKGRRPLC